MPYRIAEADDGYSVKGPGGSIKSKGTTLRKARAQLRLLNAIEHGFIPRKGRGHRKAGKNAKPGVD